MAKLYNETGFSKKKKSDATCRSILEFVRPMVEIYGGKTYEKFTCEEYMEKPSYGKNYKIKVDAGSEFLHLHLFKPLSGNYQVNFIERGRKKNDDLALPFDLRNITPSIKAGSFWNYT
ncbi:hypothetical protein SteCoe_5308 [Stentor coeruleus]|uniref:Uncharacterized protein n=1 Tax=Stentor coeruleus TaxID=5963 RepID=A0A1R2CSL6_9CILI|nr:hypothetical protein SteCoe_5308 [Stentor coeruleus]